MVKSSPLALALSMQSSEDYSVIAQTMQKEFKVSEQRANQLIAAFLQWFSLVPFLGQNDDESRLPTIRLLWLHQKNLP
jgi:hypothetical protein